VQDCGAICGLEDALRHSLKRVSPCPSALFRVLAIGVEESQNSGFQLNRLSGNNIPDSSNLIYSSRAGILLDSGAGADKFGLRGHRIGGRA